MTYSAGAVKFSFWFLEFKTTAQLLCSGKTMEEIKCLNEANNIYNASSKARAKLIYNTTAVRMKALDPSFSALFCQSDLATQKLLTLTAILRHDRLFFEFFHEVIREQMLLGTNVLTDMDVRTFFQRKQSESEKVAAWTTETLDRLGKTYKNYLTGAGLLESRNGKKTTRKIYPPILDQPFVDWLQAHELGYMVNLLSGVR